MKFFLPFLHCVGLREERQNEIYIPLDEGMYSFILFLQLVYLSSFEAETYVV